MATAQCFGAPDRDPGAVWVRHLQRQIHGKSVAPMLACRIRSLSGQSFDLEVPPESTVKDVKYRIEQDWAIPKICQKLLYRRPRYCKDFIPWALDRRSLEKDAPLTRPLAEMTAFETRRWLILLYDEPLDDWIGRDIPQYTSGRYKDVAEGEILTKVKAKAYRAFQARHHDRNNVGRMADKLVCIVDKYLPRQAEETRICVGRLPPPREEAPTTSKARAQQSANKTEGAHADVTPTATLRDQLLAEKCRCQSFADGCIELQLVITTEILRSSLSSALALEALQGLHGIAKESAGDPKVWSAVEAEVWDSLNQPLRDVQDLATSVLMAAAGAGRSGTREEVLERLESQDERSRLVAVQMLGIMGDASADALRRRLLDPSDTVRAAAAEALASRPEFLDQAARFALSALLHDRSALVRTAAMRGLARFVSMSGCPVCAPAGDSQEYAKRLEFAFLAVLARLQHPDPSVRSSVAGAAGAVLNAAARRRCERCNGRRRPEAAEETSFATMAAQALSACLADECAAVRALALQALAEFHGGNGKDRKIMAPELSALKNQVAPCLKHMDAGVRVAATRATVRLVQNGDRESIQVLQRLVQKDTDISVRTAAKNALLALGVDPF
ncbi:hypothetical protein AK812_SmicGene30421 [Symbiodinium microadriaticum]|uniref:Ubiquitin-like domain-containing protein n=1 Tax=Symbiodinium microadriaticum TaxID=2951 RepID=A0A1Q9CZC3_SYMMI|nr:hypothetical protein AK812_SmicGene30421 [Symbiodinium microadriaticum]